MANGQRGEAARVGLLLTRTQAASQRFLNLLPAKSLANVTVIVAPLLRIEKLLEPADLAGAAGVIFTSSNGVHAAPAPQSDLPAFCVGKRTTDVARAAGWQAQFSGATAEELVSTLAAQRPEAPLVHLHGRHTRGDVAKRLSDLGLKCEGKTIYEQHLQQLEPQTRRLISAQSDLIVPLFSPRLARHFASLGIDQVNLSLIALSQAVAAELKGLPCKDLQVSTAPDAESMAQLVRDAAERLAHLEGGSRAQ